ncbi:LysR family substrate-binding domain-containing protein [Kitasatospora sp. NPDC059646]|uniref:LysR family substrate-binding domain-containing protein n=1 Tax=Kitasatospora sp. NPDC059646 TaxID=3346893 RepID=UPI0036CF66E3
MTEIEQPSASFRLVYVPGVTPTKWLRVWGERLPDVPLELLQSSPADGHGLLLSGGADAGLVRLPVDRTVLSAIPLYTETTVVVFPKDHWLAAAEEVAVADLDEEIVFHPQDDTLDWARLPGRPAFERPATTGDAIELVAANVGVLAVPQSLARLHHRRDLTYRPLTGDVPQSQVALAWPEEATTDLVEEFIGIVRGRTANSSRGRAAAEPAKKQPAAEKAAARSGNSPAQPGGRQQKPRGAAGRQGQAPGKGQGKGAARAKRGRKR